LSNPHNAALPLLHVRGDGTVDQINPGAVDLLGISVFDAIDRPLEELIAQAGELTIQQGALPDTGDGQIVALVEPAPAAAEAVDDWAGPLLDELEQRLVRAAEGMPLELELINREMFHALTALRRIRQHEEDLFLAEVFSNKLSPGMGDCQVDEVLQVAFLSLAPWMRLSGAEVVREQSGELAIDGNQGLIGRLIEEALLDALTHVRHGERITVTLDNDGQTFRIRITGGGRPIELAEQIARLHGGETITSEGLFEARFPSRMQRED